MYAASPETPSLARCEALEAIKVQAQSAWYSENQSQLLSHKSNLPLYSQWNDMVFRKSTSFVGLTEYAEYVQLNKST